MSGNGSDFGGSNTAQGVLAFARILNDQEVIVVANTHTRVGWQGEVIVDYALNQPGTAYQVVFSNLGAVRAAPSAIVEKPAGNVRVAEINGAVTHGPAR